MNMRSGIICGGTLVLDKIKIMDFYPEEGMLGNIISETQNGGGAVFNVLSDLSVIDKKIPLYAAGLVGKDEFGKYLITELKKKNIDCRSISQTRLEATACTDVIFSKKTGSRTFFHRTGSNSLLGIKHLKKINIPAKIFHLGYLMILDELDSTDEKYGSKSARFLASLKERNFITAVDFVSVDRNDYDISVSHCLPYIDYLIINEIEAEKSTLIATRSKKKISESGLTKAALKLLRKGVQKAVIIHYPEGGFALSKTGDKVKLPSYKIPKNKLKGTVGAGDAFCAGILYSIHEGLDIEMSVKIANASAWFNLQNETSTGGAVPISKIMELVD